MSIQSFSGLNLSTVCQAGAVRGILRLSNDVLGVIVNCLLESGQEGKKALENLANTAKQLNRVVRLAVQEGKDWRLKSIISVAERLQEALQHPKMVDSKLWIQSEINRSYLKFHSESGVELGLSVWKKDCISNLLEAMMSEILRNGSDENILELFGQINLSKFPKEAREIVSLCKAYVMGRGDEFRLQSVILSLLTLGYYEAAVKLIPAEIGEMLQFLGVFVDAIKADEERGVNFLFDCMEHDGNILGNAELLAPTIFMSIFRYGLDAILDRISRIADLDRRNELISSLCYVMKFSSVSGIDDKILPYFPEWESPSPHEPWSTYLGIGMTRGFEAFVKSVFQNPDEDEDFKHKVITIGLMSGVNVERLLELLDSKAIGLEAKHFHLQLFLLRFIQRGDLKAVGLILEKWVQFSFGDRENLLNSLSQLQFHFENIGDLEGLKWVDDWREKLVVLTD